MKRRFLFLAVALLGISSLKAQEQPVQIRVKPIEIHDVLNNPGIGFTTFQRFNGDSLNAGEGWTEGLPILYQKFDGNLTNKNHPQTTIAYFRVDWKYMEPEMEKYNWPMIDKALRTAAERGQTLMLRIAPYEAGEKDVPAWYRKLVGPEDKNQSAKWRIDPEDPRYIQYFGGLIQALGQRYDGHPDLESVDVSIVGYWGEGDGSHLLSDQTRLALLNCYLDNFKKTPLTFQPLNGDAPDPGVIVKGTNISASWPDGRNNGTGTQMRYLGYRVDCLGDMTTDLWPEKHWSHMTDIYPKDIVKSGMSEVWKKAPVTMEICYTFLHWLQTLKYDEQTVDYIFGEALKWHITSFNAKSSPVPEVWSPLVDKWLNKMGYRYVLRRFEYPSVVTRQGQLSYTSLWENVGVAPIYKDYKLAVRLKNSHKTLVLPTCAELLNWLPGDIVDEETLYIPFDMPLGKYQLEIAIVSPVSFEPRVKLAISGVNKDEWYPMGEIEVKDQK
ncbi:hypothetical protein AQPE_4422 [Aquipluma nitroreducens]|uniref:DUF4832 domain-containing protein n=1 Tax=Aquipluma nitroreducens TaxID=2010828 RepID=A0A5K7SF58_9BACT|nr:DUF4832 domain-containing protein [Aquipluma nitroreducens]BBE20231.1 hypothetical protein AQPE_4422 [Aquipluma nitroreducens]